jgi:demethylmenaquinone methyltransferase / 2-methoxy-6-polyprenyl-1,4-benzoquinol methylase
MNQETLDKSPQAIRGMFTRIAARYDLLNRLISLGNDMRLRREMIAHFQGRNPQRIADIGAGTGDVSILLSKAHPDCMVLACDLTLEMIRVGKTRTQAPNINWVVCDSAQLPFNSQMVDGVVSAYLLRNVLDLPAVLKEQARITRENGLFLTLEMTPPRSKVLFPFVWLYFHTVIPLLGWLVAGNPKAYQYLPSSSLQFLPAEELSRQVSRNGWQDASLKRKMMGVMAIHRAQRKA